MVSGDGGIEVVVGLKECCVSSPEFCDWLQFQNFASSVISSKILVHSGNSSTANIY